MASFWNDAKTVLSTVAPTLASAVGGPLAGTAVNAIIGALGLAPDTPPEKVAAVVTAANFDQLAALQKAEQDFTAHMAQLNIDLQKLTTDDRASARARESAVKDKTPAIMGYVVLAGSVLAGAAVLAGYVSDTSMQAGVVIGYVFGEARQVLAYYFGASADSDAKNALLYKSTPAK